jgi:hypothetical protein
LILIVVLLQKFNKNNMEILQSILGWAAASVVNADVSGHSQPPKSL